MQESGADVLRLWVASTDFRNDMGISKNILKQVSDAFSKIRNTCRFLISNLNEFDAKADAVGYKDLNEIDKWALLKLQRLVGSVRKAYETYELHMVFHSIYDYCVNDLSALYFDMLKDRMYCGEKKGLLRRSSQTVMREMLFTMVKLFAPVLSFTAEDIWRFVDKSGSSIFEQKIPDVNNQWIDTRLEEKWNRLLDIRSEIYKVIEQARAEKLISHPLEGRVEVSIEGDDHKLLKEMEDRMPSILIVSEFDLKKGSKDIKVKKAEGKKCERCWMYLKSVGRSKKHPSLCERCEKVVSVAG